MPVILVPPLVAVVAAILAVLLVLAAPAILRLLHALFDQIPVVGGYLASAAEAVINTTTSAVVMWAQEAAAALARPIFAVMLNVWHLGEKVVSTMAAVTVALPRVLGEAYAWGNAVLGQADAWYHAGLAFASDAAASALAQADAWGNAVLGQAHQWFVDAQAFTDSAVAVAKADLYQFGQAVWTQAQQWFTSAEADAHAMFNQAEADITAATNATMGAVTDLAGRTAADIAGAEAQAIAVAGTLATTAATGAIDVLDQAAHDLVLGPWAALLPELGTITEHLPADVAQAIPGLEALPRDLPVSVPGILALLAPAIAGVATETARCTVPMCENLGGLSTLFAGLRDAAFLGLLVALMEEAVHNPGGFAATVQEDLYGPAKAAYDAARDLVGV